MNNNAKLFQHLLAGLDDNELEDLSSAVYQERQTRIQSNIVAGRYPNPTPEELAIWNHDKLKAIQAYKARGNDVSIIVIKCLFEARTRS